MRIVATVKSLGLAAALGVAGVAAPAVAHADTPPPPDVQFHRMTAPSGPRLGVKVTELTEPLRAWLGAPRDAGVLVGDIAADSAGARAGLRVGDVVTAFGGDRVTDAEDLRAALADHKEGETVPMTVVRDKKPVTLAVVVPKAEPAPFAARRGGGPVFDLPDGRTFSFDWNRIEQRLGEIERRLEKLEKGNAGKTP